MLQILLRPRTWLVIFGLSVLLAALACGRPEPEIIERTVVLEKIVEQTVLVPITKEVEKIVEVEKKVMVIVTATPESVAVNKGPVIYKLGIFQEPETRNFWNFYGGPGDSVWTGYVLDGVSTSLYTYSEQRFDWVPLLADGFPSPLAQETVGGKTYWTSEIKLKKGAEWSDGVEITADDFVFVVETAMELELGSNFFDNIDPEFLDHVQALDSHTVKVFFRATDGEGNPQTPGLSVWQFGLAFTPILPMHYWEPVVASAKASGSDIETQQQSLFAYIPGTDEPTAGGLISKRWEPGAFIENEKAPNWFRTGIWVKEYENGAYREFHPDNGYDVTYYGEATGRKTLEFEIGPHYDSEIFNIYEDQDTALLALAKGDIDYLFNPLGLRKGLEKIVNAAPDLELITNPASNIRYLGFNVRKAPMDSKAFRQAVALVIDKEFFAEQVLQGAAIPAYAMVPEGNTFWHNTNVPKIGKGLDRSERVAEAVRILKDAGFTYEVEPQVSEDGAFMEVRGEGLRMPNGNPVPELTILSPSEGYDHLRATFARHIDDWLNDIGIPAHSQLTGFGPIVDTLFDPDVGEKLDMWILGWSLALFPSYMELYFHSANAEGGFNWGGYSNPEYDRLAQSFQTQTGLDDARNMIFKMQEFLADDLPYATLFSTPMADAYRFTKLKFPYTSVLGGVQFVNGLQQEVRIE